MGHHPDSTPTQISDEQTEHADENPFPRFHCLNLESKHFVSGERATSFYAFALRKPYSLPRKSARVHGRDGERPG